MDRGAGGKFKVGSPLTMVVSIGRGLLTARQVEVGKVGNGWQGLVKKKSSGVIKDQFSMWRGGEDMPRAQGRSRGRISMLAS